MKRVLLLPAACLLDALAGDPEWYPHPVRLIGLAVLQGEKLLRRPNRSNRFNLCAGALLTVLLVAGTFYLARLLIRRLGKKSPYYGNTLELLLAWNCLAARNLYDEARAVSNALVENDIAKARRRLSRIVGRDTSDLSASEISRAVIETVAESASDGVLAPMLYLAIGGVPLALAYKAVNTLDSMIGHADARYLHFGKFAARLDDAANFIPARLTALAIVGAALFTRADPQSAASTWIRDGRLHKSPNAGQPESAISGALKVRLGGQNSYAGEVVPTPIIGAEFSSAAIHHIHPALRILVAVTLLGLSATTLVAHLTRRSA